MAGVVNCGGRGGGVIGGTVAIIGFHTNPSAKREFEIQASIGLHTNLPKLPAQDDRSYSR